MEELNPNTTVKSGQTPDHRHRFQSLWQIWLPMGIVFLLAVGLFSVTLITTQGGTANLGQYQVAAIILLILPLTLLGILMLFALVFMILVTSQMFPLIPRLREVSQRLDSISSIVTSWSNRLMLPFVLVRKLRNRMASRKHKHLVD
jgi:amino acid transporter